MMSAGWMQRDDDAAGGTDAANTSRARGPDSPQDAPSSMAAFRTAAPLQLPQGLQRNPPVPKWGIPRGPPAQVRRVRLELPPSEGTGLAMLSQGAEGSIAKPCPAGRKPGSETLTESKIRN